MLVINKASTGMLRNLSNLNMAGGGIPFMERGGIVPQYTNGGLPAMSVGTAARSQQEYAEMFLEFVKNMPSPVVGVQEILTGTERVVRVQESATW